MRFSFIYSTMILLFGVFLFLSNSSGRATIANEGNTGAPGDNAPNGRTCQNCHNSSAIQTSLDIQIMDTEGNAVTSYVPGTVYTASVTINALVGAPNAYGFQMVSEKDADNTATNSWQNPANNVKVVSTTNGRSYAEQNGPSSSNVFEVEWVAPEAGTGSVTFYAAGNGVNSNGNSGGDGAATSSFTLQEGDVNSVAEVISRPANLTVFPNPAVDRVFLDAEGIDPGPVQFVLTDLQGRLIDQQTLSGQATLAVTVDQLTPGLYLAQLRQGNKRWSGKILKR